MYAVAIIVRSRNSSNTHVHSKCLWRFLFFDSFFSIVAFSENNDLDFDTKLSNFFSGKPSVFDFHQFFIQTPTHDSRRRRVDLLFLRGYKTVFGPIVSLYSKWVKSTLSIYRRSSSSINDRCFCLTVHKSTLVVNEASMERLLNLLPSFYLGYTSHY